MEKIITETKSGNFFNYGDGNGLKSEILRSYKEFSNGNLRIAPEGIEKYSRKELTKQMASLIKSV